VPDFEPDEEIVETSEVEEHADNASEVEEDEL